MIHAQVTPSISVAVCTWNRSQSLATTLEYMTRLDLPPGFVWELLVVNNNSTDDTDDVCRAFAKRLPLRLLHEKQTGQSFARNLAIAEARAPSLAWTDDDVLVEPRWLIELYRAFEEHRADWVFGPSEPSWPGAPPDWYEKRHSGYFAVLDYGDQAFRVTDRLRPFFGLNFAGTVEAHRKLGGFRTEFGFKGKEGGVGEDVDLFERALTAGMAIVYTPGARVRHVIPPDRVGKQYHRRRQRVANPVFYRHLHEMFPGVPWFLGLPRFFYPKFAGDLVGYVRATVTANASDRFHHEMQILRFVQLLKEAAKQGFAKHPATAEGARQS